MPSGITFPTSWAVGEKAKASKLNAFFSAISAKFTSGIYAGDLAPDAGVQGSQLSSSPGTRITEGNIEDSAIITRHLRRDASAGSANAAVGFSDQIKDGILVAAKYGLVSIGRDKLKMTVQSVAFSVFGTGTDVVTPTTPIPTASAGVLALYTTVLTITGGSLIYNLYLDISGANYIAKVFHSATSVTGNVIFVSILNS